MNSFDNSHGTRLFNRDSEIDGLINEIAGRFPAQGLTTLFPQLIRRTWLKKFVAHYELFRRIRDLDGDLVELGVFRGLSLFSFALFNEFAGNKKRTVYGVDNFAGFTEIHAEDGQEYDVPKFAGGFSPARYYEELMMLVEAFNASAQRTRIEIVRGNVEDVTDSIVAKTGALSLVHFDVDLYIPTKAGLEAFYPLLVEGGVFLFDEYACIEWAGESKAVDEYFADKDILLKKFPWQGAPTAYLVKGEGGAQ